MSSNAPNFGGNAHVCSQLLQLVDEPVAILDLDGRIAGLSHGAQQLLGYQPLDLLGTQGADLVRSEDRAAFLQHLRNLAPGVAPPETFEAALRARLGDLRTVQVRLSPMAGSPGVPGLVLCRMLPNSPPGSVADADARSRQVAQLEREYLLRSTLVREINHRVKNSLQGLIGIMRIYEARQSQPTPMMDQCVSQLMAVAISFGLASKHGNAQILLCEMVSDIAMSVERVSQRRVEVQLLPGVAHAPVALSEQHSANISLVVNELIFNAVKHSTTAHDQGPVRVEVDRHDDFAFMRVINETGMLPEGFSFKNGTGMGTGLTLVKVLLPPESCVLSIASGTEGVVAELRLHAAVLTGNQRRD